VPANTPGQRDVASRSADGRLTADFPNLRFRTVESLRIDRVSVGMYESRNDGLHRVWIDDVVASTAYSGPMSTGRWQAPRRCEEWSRGRELNPRPTDYESVALPLSYPGIPRTYARGRLEFTSALNCSAVFSTSTRR
jgi:hypothetical protein